MDGIPFLCLYLLNQNNETIDVRHLRTTEDISKYDNASIMLVSPTKKNQYYNQNYLSENMSIYYKYVFN